MINVGLFQGFFSKSGPARLTSLGATDTTAIRPLSKSSQFFVATDTTTLLRADEIKQGVAPTGRNTTGPPCSVTVEL